MKKKTVSKKRVSKAEWLSLGLDTLATEGLQGVRIERLARDLGIAKAGFYWHFRDRKDLLQNMLDYWSQEFTAVISENSRLQEMEPKQRLYHTALTIMEHDLAKYDLAIRDWAAHDRAAQKAVQRVYRMRFAFVEAIFAELGFRGNQLKMRTRLFVVYHSWEQTVMDDSSKEERRRLLRLRHKLLLTK